MRKSKWTFLVAIFLFWQSESQCQSTVRICTNHEENKDAVLSKCDFLKNENIKEVFDSLRHGSGVIYITNSAPINSIRGSIYYVNSEFKIDSMFNFRFDMKTKKLERKAIKSKYADKYSLIPNPGDPSVSRYYSCLINSNHKKLELFALFRDNNLFGGILIQNFALPASLKNIGFEKYIDPIRAISLK